MKKMYGWYGAFLIFTVADAQQAVVQGGESAYVCQKKRRELFSQDARPEEWLYTCHPGTLTVLMPFKMLDITSQLGRRSARLLEGPVHMPSEGTIAQVKVRGPLESEPDQQVIVTQEHNHPLQQLQLEPQDDSFVVILFSTEPPVFLITYHNHTIALALGDQVVKTIVETYEAYLGGHIEEITMTLRGILRQVQERSQLMADNFARNYALYIPPEIPLPLPQVPSSVPLQPAYAVQSSSNAYRAIAFPYRHPVITILGIACGVVLWKRYLSSPVEMVRQAIDRGAVLLARVGLMAPPVPGPAAQSGIWSIISWMIRGAR
jgi:hypothetical protein